MRINFELNIKKWIAYPSILTSIIFSSYIYATPYISIISFKSAIENKDTESARKYINFPSVRASLKSQIKEVVSQNLKREIGTSNLAVFSIILINPMVNALVNSTVNATVTPKGLKTLLTQGKLSQSDKNLSDKSTHIKKNDTRISLYYKGINYFILKTEIPTIKAPMKAYWKRNFLWDWKLTSIDLPFELIKNLQ